MKEDKRRRAAEDDQNGAEDSHLIGRIVLSVALLAIVIFFVFMLFV